MRRSLRLCILLPALAAWRQAVAEDPIDFRRQVQPILADKCYACHGPDAQAREADLRLDTEAGALRERAGQPVIARGDSASSELVRRILAADPGERMPPPGSKRSLSPAEIDILRRWIDEGARWAGHWAFQAPIRPALPPVRRPQWAATAIDFFVLAALESQGLEPSPEAPRETLIRRLSLDLVGLPPTLSEIDAFLADDAPGAYARLVDRLLASPRHGEALVWEWLDAARYADTNGYQGDPTRTMWPWRDWVIRAINTNLRFDEFTISSLAGDLLPGAGNDELVASGFHRNHALNAEGGRIPEETRVENVVDRVDTTATVWLGLTLGCARCHDHKYDPFSQKEYYQLFAFFNNVSDNGTADEWPHAKPVLPLPTPEEAGRIAALERTVAGLKAAPAPSGSGSGGGSSSEADASERKKKLEEAEKSLRDARRFATKVMVMDELKTPRQSFVLVRGAYDSHGERVEAGVPAILPPLPAQEPANRLTLARWLVSPDHPLTARVAVNRVWQRSFGTGLVKTAEDFGVQGERPSHPELLDWLAVELIESGWDLKALHRTIALSAAYRQTSAAPRDLHERDPENRWLGRGPRFRLSSGAIRDQALAASGLLVERIGGPPVKPYQPAGVWEDMTFGQISYKQDHGPSLHRRSLYTFWRRTVAPTTFFDVPSRQVCSVRTARTNTPLHALGLLNDVTFVEAARKLAERVLLAGGAPDAEKLSTAFRLCTARRPDPAEAAALSAALERQRRHFAVDGDAAEALVKVGESARDPRLAAPELAAWTVVASLLLNLDETLTKE